MVVVVVVVHMHILYIMESGRRRESFLKHPPTFYILYVDRTENGVAVSQIVISKISVEFCI